MNTCRFELQIKNTKQFQCAAKFGFDGWAYSWQHEEWRDPCIDCPIKINGRPLVVDGEVKSRDFGEVAGRQIRARDWKEIHKRGYEIKRNGICKI